MKRKRAFHTFCVLGLIEFDAIYEDKNEIEKENLKHELILVRENYRGVCNILILFIYSQ